MNSLTTKQMPKLINILLSSVLHFLNALLHFVLCVILVWFFWGFSNMYLFQSRSLKSLLLIASFNFFHHNFSEIILLTSNWQNANGNETVPKSRWRDDEHRATAIWLQRVTATPPKLLKGVLYRQNQGASAAVFCYTKWKEPKFVQ